MNPEIVHLTLPGNRPPWTPAGLTVAAGDQVTVLGSGFLRWSPKRDAGAGAKFHLWGRVPGGLAFNLTQDTTTVTADRSGPLELCVYRGVWADDLGTLRSSHRLYEPIQGALAATVVRWPAGTDPIDGLTALLADPASAAGADPALLEAELHRLRHPIPHPAGWTHFRDLGRTDIFRAAAVDGAPAIEVVCDNDAGIIQRAVEVPLGPDTTIEWTWKVDALPSPVAEDTTFTHDYLSIATEFDSGRDLTWFWSRCLEPVEGTFACPMPGWRRRETHMPLRSGTAELGRFHRERRNVWSDHQRFMGDPPGRIVAVWLIASSNASRHCGTATFTDIALRSGSGPGATTVQVL